MNDQGLAPSSVIVVAGRDCDGTVDDAMWVRVQGTRDSQLARPNLATPLLTALPWLLWLSE